MSHVSRSLQDKPNGYLAQVGSVQRNVPSPIAPKREFVRATMPIVSAEGLLSLVMEGV